MKATLISIAFFFLTFLGFFCSHVDSQTQDSCSSNLNLQNQLPFDTTSFNCDPVWNSQGFILRYSQTNPNVWSFVLSAPDMNGYIAMGFSPNGQMVGSSAIVGWLESGGTPMIKQYYLAGQSSQLVYPDQGNLTTGNSSSVIAVSSRIYMAFQLITDTPGSRLIYAVGPAGVLPAGPNYLLTQHTDEVSTVLNYATGQSSQTSGPYSKLKKGHGILNMLGWGILLPIGAIAARYLKQWDPMWFYCHTAIQSLGFMLGVAGVICGFVLEDRLQIDVDKHKGLGIFVLILGCLQVMAILARPDKASKVRKYWNWYHHNVGRILIIFGAANIFYGIHLGDAGRDWNAGYAIALVILFLTAVVLEVRLWMRK